MSSNRTFQKRFSSARHRFQAKQAYTVTSTRVFKAVDSQLLSLSWSLLFSTLCNCNFTVHCTILGQWRIQTLRLEEGGGGGGGHPDPEKREGAPVSKKLFFRPLQPQFGPKERGPGSATTTARTYWKNCPAPAV